MKKTKQIILLFVCFLLLMAGSYQQYKKVWGHDFKTAKTDLPSRRTNTIQTLEDGTQVINTTDLAKDISGYGGRVPLEIYIKDGKITKVKALRNSETPDFFQQASILLTRWNGKTPEEALQQKVDGISGATFSSRGILGNMQRGLQYAAKTSTQKSILAQTDHSPKNIAVIIILLMAAVLPLFYHHKNYRILQQILNISVLGFWGGIFLSYTLFVNYMANGINLWVSLSAVIMLVTAFIYPLFGKKNYYCNNICPFGSLQELLGRTNKKYKIKMSSKTVRILTTFRQFLWLILTILMLTGISTEWMNYEIFTAFILSSASLTVIILAILFLLLSFFVPRPYCRFLCPTGTLFKIAQGSEKIALRPSPKKKKQMYRI